MSKSKGGWSGLVQKTKTQTLDICKKKWLFISNASLIRILLLFKDPDYCLTCSYSTLHTDGCQSLLGGREGAIPASCPRCHPPSSPGDWSCRPHLLRTGRGLDQKEQSSCTWECQGNPTNCL